MLKNTFIHIPGIGIKTEQRLWDSGVLDWDSYTESITAKLPQSWIAHIGSYVDNSIEHFQNNDPNYFEKLLSPSRHWRIFSDFRNSTVYLDIETTGLNAWGNHITTIALYDGESIFHYVKDRNLGDFPQDIQKYKVIVTYNGKCFDVPFIENYFGINLTQAHIDLRYILASLGYRGGLKGCEKQIGINRGDLEDIDGYFAVLLWHDYKQNRNLKALETLLAYNIQDTVNLETLMVFSYNMKLSETPFFQNHQLPLPVQPENPFRADSETIDQIKWDA